MLSPATRFVAFEAKLTNAPLALIAGAPEGPSAAPPPRAVLTSAVVPVCRSRTKTSGTPLLSPATRFVAADSNTTKRPSAERSGFDDGPSGSPPSTATLTRVTVPSRSVRKMSATPLPSPAARFDADETNATRVPSAESTGARDGPFAPPGADEISRRSPVVTLNVKTSRTAPFASPATKPPAVDANPTVWPSADSDVSPLSPASSPRSGAVETRNVRSGRLVAPAVGASASASAPAAMIVLSALTARAAVAGGRARRTARWRTVAVRRWRAWTRRAWEQAWAPAPGC